MSFLNRPPLPEPGNQAGDIVLIRAQLRASHGGESCEVALKVTTLGVISHSVSVPVEQRPSADWFGLHHFVSFFAYRAYGQQVPTDHVPTESAMNVGNYWVPDAAIVQNFGGAQRFDALLRNPTAPSGGSGQAASCWCSAHVAPLPGDLLLVEESGSDGGDGPLRAAALLLAYQPGLVPNEPFFLHVLGCEQGQMLQLYTRFSAARISLARTLGQAVWCPLDGASLSDVSLPMAHRHDPWGFVS